MKMRMSWPSALVAPLLTVTRTFSDVTDSHEHRAPIRWASDPANFPHGQALFVGYEDGNFRPDKDLTEDQLIAVIKRLLDSQDSWTRAETAALFHHGYIAPYGNRGDQWWHFRQKQSK